MRGVKKQRSPGGNVLSDDGGARNNGDHGFSGGRHKASADGGSLRNARGTATTPTSSTPLSKPPSTFGKVRAGCGRGWPAVNLQNPQVRDM